MGRWVWEGQNKSMRGRLQHLSNQRIIQRLRTSEITLIAAAAEALQRAMTSWQKEGVFNKELSR
jgi:hypothetical protein